MSKTTHKKRLERLNKNRKEKEDPSNNTKDYIELFTELATEGVISAETLTAIHAQKSERDFEPFKCFTNKELDSILYLLNTPEEREQEKEKYRLCSWKEVCDLKIEDMERLDKIVAKWQ